MTIDTLVQLDPRIWPVAIMSFLRVLTIFVWLPILGESIVPMRIKILFSVVFTFLMWPVIEKYSPFLHVTTDWSWPVLVLTTLREAFFGFAVGFSARIMVFGVSVASQLVGVNMGFQAASLFNPMLSREETAFSSFQGWLLLVVMLAFNIHHVFIEGIAKSFFEVPIGPIGSVTSITQAATHCLESIFEMALRLAAPLLLIQTVVTLALGLMNRALPQLNVFVMNFPLSFVLSMIVLFFSAGAIVRFLGSEGLHSELSGFEGMKRAFHTVK